MASSPYHCVLGAGPAGWSVARQLAALDASVTLVSRRVPSGLPKGVQHTVADLSNPVDAKGALSRARVIYHCAAPRYDRWAQDFPRLQSSIIDAAANAGAKLVVLDNAYGYGQTGVLTEATPMQASGKKGSLRARMADDLLKRHKTGDVQAVLARASDFVGPRVRVAALGERFWPRILAGKKPAWIGNPDLPHSHTNIDDLGRAMITLSNAPDDAYGRAWHVPTAPALSANQIATIAFAQLDMAPKPVSAMSALTQTLLSPFIPVLREVAEVRYQCDAPFVLDSSAFQAKFGMAPRSMDTTIAETLTWWRSLPPES